MKKLLALFLVFSMLLAMLTVPTFADPAPTLPEPEVVVTEQDLANYEDGDTYSYDDGDGVKNYIVVREITTFLGIKNGSNYILAEDLDFKDIYIAPTKDNKGNDVIWTVDGVIKIAGYVAATGNFILEGNGHTIENLTLGYTSGAGKGMFGTIAANTTTKVRNLTINVSGEMVQNSLGVLFGASDKSKDAHVYIEGVTINAENLTFSSQNAGQGAALFFAKPRCNVYLKDCVANGFKSTSPSKDQGVAAFIGRTDQWGAADCTYSFDNCHAIGNYAYTYTDPDDKDGVTPADSHAIFFGWNNVAATVTFNNCSVNATFGTTSQYSGAFVGKNQKATISFTNCRLIGDNYTFSYTDAGGYIGYNGATASFTNCTIEGNLSLTKGNTAGFVGNAEGPVSFDGCRIIGNLTCTGGKNGGFVGVTNKALTFNNCHYTGTITGTAVQIAGFVGCFNNPGSATFTNCTATADVVTNQSRVSHFVGQAYSGGTINFNTCTASGTFVNNNNNVAYNEWNGAFMGVAGGSWSGDGGVTVSRQNAIVNFTGCTANVFMVGYNTTSAYVGANGGGNPTITFDNCKNASTVYSLGSAGVWYGGDEATYGAGEATVTVKANCTSTATVKSVTLYGGEGDVVTAEAIEDGSYAYEIAQAQKAAGIETNIVGQTIGTDATPKFGGAAVEIVTTAKGETVYANGKYTVEGEVEPKSYIQLTPVASNKRNARVIIAVSDEKLAEINTVTITFTLADETTKTFTVEKNDIDSYYAVWAGGEIAEAAEGYVLLAVAIKNIPVGTDGANWNVVNEEEPQNVVVTVA